MKNLTMMTQSVLLVLTVLCSGLGLCVAVKKRE